MCNYNKISSGPIWALFIIFSYTMLGEFTSLAHALPGCQVLDRSASKFDITLDIFGDTKKSKVENVRAFLWIDPEFPENAQLVASLQPQISKLFGKFEDNPLLIGMMANFLDKELVFKSSTISKKLGSDDYKVKGQVTSGNKKYPADFLISSKSIGKTQSSFAAKVQSDNFEKILGVPGNASGDFNLVFRFNPDLSKERCVL